METILTGLRSVLGEPNLYIDGVLDYGRCFEYLFSGIIVCIVVSSIFKFLVKVFCK